MTTIQKVNCKKCLKDLHDECLDPNTCLCAKSHYRLNLPEITLKELKESAKQMSKTEISEIETHTECAELIMSKYNFKTLKDTREVLFYYGGVYQELGEVLIAELCEEIINDCKRTFVNEVIGVIQRSTFTDREKFNQDLTKLVLENGIIDLNTKKLSEHDPNFLTTIKIPVEYQPGATCFGYIKFLNECLDPKDIITVIEEASNVLTANNKNFEVSAIWLGDGANGKTTNMNIINGVYGHENCSHVSIHDMGKIRFAVAQLYGRLLNSYADISNEELDNLGMFKQLISGDTIQAEKKNKDPFNFTPYANHFFSANEMPQIKDNSDGAFRRIYLTKWKNQFLPGVFVDDEGLVQASLDAVVDAPVHELSQGSALVHQPLEQPHQRRLLQNPALFLEQHLRILWHLYLFEQAAQILQSPADVLRVDPHLELG